MKTKLMIRKFLKIMDPFEKIKNYILIEVKINNKISVPCLIASMPMSTVFAGARSSMEHTVGI